MVEQWLPVVGFSLYEVSDQGQVRTVRTSRIRKLHMDGFGYLSLELRRDKVGYHCRVHHLVLEAFVGPRPSAKHQARHLDDDPFNNVLSNLAWGTASDNQYDKVRNGRHHNASRLICVNGHEFTEGNTYLQRSTNKRACRTCGNERSRIYREKKRAEVAKS